jgi:hypothetical protein
MDDQNIVLVQNCVSNPSTLYWNENNCIPLFSQFINQNLNGLYSFNQYNNSYLQSQINILFQNYINKYGQNFYSLPALNQDDFLPELLSLCNNRELPGSCETFLQSYCQNFTRSEVAANTNLTNLCGCYVSPSDYITKYNINPSCDFLCNRSLSSRKLDNAEIGTLSLCENNICVIDDININVTDSVLNSGINFNSICSSCAGSACTCIISGINISNLLGSIGVVDNLNEYCGGTGSLCITKDSNGNIISEIPCENFKQDLSFFSGVNINYLLIAFVLILIVAIMLFALGKF